MEMVLNYSHRWRPIVSLPFAVGAMQGFFLEKLPVNLLTVTRAQVCLTLFVTTASFLLERTGGTTEVGQHREPDTAGKPCVFQGLPRDKFGALDLCAQHTTYLPRQVNTCTTVRQNTTLYNRMPMLVSIVMMRKLR
jgi:hypothetical protein